MRELKAVFSQDSVLTSPLLLLLLLDFNGAGMGPSRSNIESLTGGNGVYGLGGLSSDGLDSRVFRFDSTNYDQYVTDDGVGPRFEGHQTYTDVNRETTGGVYAKDLYWFGDTALVIQPTGSFFYTGSWFEVKCALDQPVSSAGESLLGRVALDYWHLHDQARSHTISLSTLVTLSNNSTGESPIPGASWTTGDEAPDVWAQQTEVFPFVLTDLPQGTDAVYLRFTHTSIGSGPQDEFGFDNIQINITNPYPPTAASVSESHGSASASVLSSSSGSALMHGGDNEDSSSSRAAVSSRSSSTADSSSSTTSASFSSATSSPLDDDDAISSSIIDEVWFMPVVSVAAGLFVVIVGGFIAFLLVRRRAHVANERNAGSRRGAGTSMRRRRTNHSRRKNSLAGLQSGQYGQIGLPLQATQSSTAAHRKGSAMDIDSYGAPMLIAEGPEGDYQFPGVGVTGVPGGTAEIQAVGVSGIPVNAHSNQRAFGVDNSPYDSISKTTEPTQYASIPAQTKRSSKKPLDLGEYAAPQLSSSSEYQ